MHVGGQLSCDTVTANKVDFKTSGGAMAIKRLVGKQCLLDAQPAAAAFPAVAVHAEGQVARDAHPAAAAFTARAVHAEGHNAHDACPAAAAFPAVALHADGQDANADRCCCCKDNIASMHGLSRPGAQLNTQKSQLCYLCCWLLVVNDNTGALRLSSVCNVDVSGVHHRLLAVAINLPHLQTPCY